MAPVHLYLKYKQDDADRWQPVNGHTVRISLGNITPRNGATASAIKNYVVFTDRYGKMLLEAAGQPVAFVDAVTTTDSTLPLYPGHVSAR